MKLKKKDIGQIDLMGAYSFFEVDKNMTEKVTKGFEGAELKGRQIRVEVTEARAGGSAPRREAGASHAPRKSYSGKKSSDRDRFQKKRR